ncbi:hypothetical protein LguiA_002630 [Lonicera macranthoides]
MADAVLNVVVEEVSKKVLSLIGEEIGLVWSFKEELARLSESLTMIRAVLHDAEARQVHEEAMKLWMQRLKGVVDDVEIALDEFAYKILQRKLLVTRRRAAYYRPWVKIPKPCTKKMKSVTPPVVVVAYKGKPTLCILSSHRTMCSRFDQFSRQAK